MQRCSEFSPFFDAHHIKLLYYQPLRSCRDFEEPATNRIHPALLLCRILLANSSIGSELISKSTYLIWIVGISLPNRMQIPVRVYW